MEVRNAPRLSGDTSQLVAWAVSRFKELGTLEVSGAHTHVRMLSRSFSYTWLKYKKNSLCIRDAKEAFSVKPRFPEHFQYMTLDVQDNEDQNLIRLFPRRVSQVAFPALVKLN
jgi:hypothetical protein